MGSNQIHTCQIKEKKSTTNWNLCFTKRSPSRSVELVKRTKITGSKLSTVLLFHNLLNYSYYMYSLLLTCNFTKPIFGFATACIFAHGTSQKELGIDPGPVH